MSKTTWVSRVARPRQIRRPDPSKVIVSTTRQTAGEWRFSPPGGATGWYMAVTVDIDVDPGVTGDVRLRTAAGVASTPVIIAATTRQLQLGWTFVANAGTRVFLEVRRTAGSGGLKVLNANGMAMSSPPTIDGDDPGGGSTTTASDVYGTYVTPTEATTHTILPSNISPAPIAGQKVLLLGAAAGPSEITSLTWNFPGTPVPKATGGNLVVGGGTYHPRLIATVVDYSGGTTGWTLTASGNFRAAAIALSDTVGIVAGNPSQVFSPGDPTSVANAAGAVGLAVNIINFITASVTAPAAGHTTVLASPVEPRQIHVAKIALTAAGTYDPPAATVGPGGEESTVVAIVAQPTAVSGGTVAAPTIPTFNTAGAITLALTDNIASVVAGYPANTHFQLLNGTYTDWDDVRPKTGMYFRGPTTGLATIEGTGKGYCIRALDAVGGSDNVTIGQNIKIQNYGVGTARAEFGAIQAQPTNTIGNVYDYGCATGWFIYGVELERNSSNGIRISDNCVVYQCTSYGHTVTGLGGDRNVGGLIHSCTFDANGFNPATGDASNGGNVKITFHNGAAGRLEVVPVASQRPIQTLQMVNCTFNATRAGITGTGNIGAWFDLDCRYIEVKGCTFNNHPWCALMFEGGNSVTADSCTVNNSDGYGNALNEDFILGAITVAETTNCTVSACTINNSVRALVLRQSNRPDWYNPVGSYNYAWPTSGHHWINHVGPLPVPATSDQSNMWCGNVLFQGNTLVGCDRVYLSEGTDTALMTTHGKIPLNTISFLGNIYAASPTLVAGGFFDRSLTGLSLVQWKALASLDRDQI